MINTLHEISLTGDNEYNQAQIRQFRRLITLPGIADPLQVDAFAVITERFLVICDTLLCPDDAHNMMQLLQDCVRKRQMLVINSHADWDHAWGNGFFTGRRAAPIIAHKNGPQRLQAEATRQLLQDYRQRFPLFMDVEIVLPTLLCENQMTIYGGDCTLHVLHTPGHSQDHLSIWIPESKTLLAFDAVEAPFPTLEDSTSYPAMLQTLHKLHTYAAETVFCSHGGFSQPDLITSNLHYFSRIEEKCRTWLATHHPLHTAEQIDLTTLLDYPYETIQAYGITTCDQTFYREVHQQNVRNIMTWLIENRYY